MVHPARLLWLAALSLAIVLSTCNRGSESDPAATVASPEAVLRKILVDCWNVAEIKDIDARNEHHVAAFPCAKERLLQLVREQPKYAEPHRVLGWGYLYNEKNLAAARAEYEIAAQLYHDVGQTPQEADMYRRLGLLALNDDPLHGCELLFRSQALDPQNGQTQQAIGTSQCIARLTPGAVSVPPSIVPPRPTATPKK